MNDKKRVVTLGEIMLRLKSPECTRLFQRPELEATFGGGEANVATALSLFGMDASFVTALPDNSVGEAALRELKKYGVDTSGIVRGGERLGIYFLEAGAAQRPSKVVYDRANSAISEALCEDFDWDSVFSGADWFHITGITPALSASAAELSLFAVKKAKEAGLTVSCDLNYRKKLWKYGKEAPEVMSQLVQYVDVIIANEEDCQKSLGIACDSDVTTGSLSLDHYKALSSKVLEAYPKVQKIAITLRESISASHNRWSAVLADRESFYTSRQYDINPIVDRVGGGDSFAAGMIYGLNCLDDDQKALDYAVAASCLKHSISGDIALLSSDEVFLLMKGDGSGRVQR